MADKGEKRGWGKYKNVNILRTMKKLLDKIKSIFLIFLIFCKINMQYLLDEIFQFSFVLKITTKLK